MLNKIIDISLRNRIVVLILAGLILVGGCIALMRSEIDIFPDLNAPTVVVMTEAPGLAPEEVEQLVTFPIETAVNGATGVRRVRSTSDTGFSCVWVEFDWDTDVYVARQIVSEKIATVAGELPPGIEPPVLGPQSSILGEIMIIGLTVNDSVASTEPTTMGHLRTIADRQIRPRLLSVPGVSAVAVIGGDVEEYHIQLDPDRMRHYGITLDQALAATQGINANANGGIVYDYGNEYLVKGRLNTSDLADLGATVVAASDPANIVTLADIADITLGARLPRTGVASVKAHPAVLITVTKQPGAGTIPLTERIEATLESIAHTLPADVAVSTDIFRQSTFISNSVSNLQESLLEGALMVIIVLFFFLMNLRTTVVSLVALPMSIIVSVLVLHFMGQSINTMSLGGIAIAIGSLVDDAIVDVENVYRHIRENYRRSADQRLPIATVVANASKEVRLPILNSSLIIVASFLPLFFLSGMEGRMLKPLGTAFIVALAASTIVALTLTPVLCTYLLKGGRKSQGEPKVPAITRHMQAAYTRALGWSLAHGRALLIGVGMVFAVTLGLFFTLGRSFLPPFNEGSMTINVSALPGLALDESDHIGRMAEEIILATPEVNTVARKTGRAELDEHSFGVNVSEIEAPYTLQGRSRNAMVRDLRRRLSEIPGVNIEIGQPISHRIDAMLSGTEAQISIKLFGDDLNTLYRIGNQIKQVIGEVPGITDINIEQQTERPQVVITPRRALMARYGITPADFARLVNVALSGEKVGQVYSGSLPYDITVKFNDDSRSSLERLANLPIDTPQGKVPLSSIAEVRSTTGPNTINREGVKRRIVISANMEGDSDLRGAVNSIRRAIDAQVQIPEGYYVNYSGQFESEAQASRTLAITSLFALLIIVMLLWGEFRSWGESLIILVNMPLAMIGGVLILVITGGELNIPAIIGFISLLGIATRNGMLLISRYNHLESEGMALADRIARGSADRLLPIVMTALTSALALAPLALRGTEPGNEIQSPMALVILGGLISSTALNIFVVPVLYNRLKEKTTHEA